MVAVTTTCPHTTYYISKWVSNWNGLMMSVQNRQSFPSSFCWCSIPATFFSYTFCLIFIGFAIDPSSRKRTKLCHFFLFIQCGSGIWCGIQPALAYSSHRWNSFCFSKIQQYKDSNSDDDFDVQFFNHTFFTPETWMNAILMCLFVASLSVANFNLL